jgi:hypothetical protein
MLLSLRRQVATAGPAQLAAVSSAVQTALSQAAATARQAQQASADGGGNNTSLASAQRAAREAVNEFEDAYFKQRKFEPYLQFKSEEDERAYREREAQRQTAIESAKAQGTPEGDKRALDLSIDQLRDAGTHGADRSPEYAPLYEKVADAKTTLDAQIDAAKSKPVTGAVAKPDPLDVPDAPAASVPPDLLAKFKSAGVVVADQSGTGHGVNVDANAPQDRDVRMPS